MAQYLADIREEELADESGVPPSAFVGGGGGDHTYVPEPRVHAAAPPKAPSATSIAAPENSDNDTDGACSLEGASVGSLSAHPGVHGDASSRAPRRRARLGGDRDYTPRGEEAPAAGATAAVVATAAVPADVAVTAPAAQA